jgi:hypothetical protein
VTAPAQREHSPFENEPGLNSFTPLTPTFFDYGYAGTGSAPHRLPRLESDSRLPAVRELDAGGFESGSDSSDSVGGDLPSRPLEINDGRQAHASPLGKLRLGQIQESATGAALRRGHLNNFC